MLNGNPNDKLRTSIPMPQNSRYAQGRADPMGLGVESLQGNVLQPISKINSLPGLGQSMTPRPTLSPQLQALIDQRRTTTAATQRRRSPREELGF